MANKYCNLDGTKKIKDEYGKINVGFDKVEVDINNLANDITINIDKLSNDVDKNIDNLSRNVYKNIGELHTEVENIDDKVNRIISTPVEGVSAEEIIEARKGEVSLGAKIGMLDGNFVEGYNTIPSTTDSCVSIPEGSSDGIIKLHIEGRMSDNLSCDGIKVVSEGKNLLPTNDVSAWSVGALGGNGENIASTLALRSDFIPIHPNTNIVYSNVGDYVLYQWKAYDKQKIFVETPPNDSYLIPPNVEYLRISLRKGDNSNVNVSDILNAKIQVEVGLEPTTFEPYKESHVYIPEGFYEINGVKNVLDNDVFTKNIEKVVLDSDITWVYGGNLEGYKSIRTTSILNPFTSHNVARSKLFKYNNAPAPHTNSDLAASLIAPDLHIFRHDLGLYVPVANEETGWGQNYIPTPAEMSAFFNGWRMYKKGFARAGQYEGEGGKAWYPITLLHHTYDATINVDDVVPTKLAPNLETWSYYTFYYQLTSPVLIKFDTNCLVARSGGRIRLEGWKPRQIKYNDIAAQLNVGTNLSIIGFVDQLYDADGRSGWNNSILGPVSVVGWKQAKFMDDLNRIGTYYLSNNIPIKFCFPRGTTQRQALPSLIGSVINYKLKTDKYILPTWNFEVPSSILTQVNINSEKIAALGLRTFEQDLLITNNQKRVDRVGVDLVTHVDDPISEVISISITDGATVTSETVSYLGTFKRQPRSASILANIANKKGASWGELTEGNAQHQISFAGVTGVFGSAGNRAIALLSDDSAANYLIGVASIEPDRRIKITWTKHGTGVTGTINVRVLALFHGGV